MLSLPEPQARFSLLVTGWILLSLLLSCSEPVPDEVQIEKNAREIITSIEALDFDGVEKHLFETVEFHGQQKELDVDQVRKLFALYRFKKMKITIIPSAIEVKMDRYNSSLATLHANVLITGTKGLLPREGNLYRVESHWRLNGDQWQLSKVSWQ